eukprot:gene25888-31262_t
MLHGDARKPQDNKSYLDPLQQEGDKVASTDSDIDEDPADLEYEELFLFEDSALEHKTVISGETKKDIKCPSPQDIRVLHNNLTYYQVNCHVSSLSSKKGVHHPKYLLLFTTNGVHVIISTANFTHAQALDASWIQFFPLVISSEKCNEGFGANDRDFGVVLEDFIWHQSKSLRYDIAAKKIDVLEWIDTHTHVQTHQLQTLPFRSRYAFWTAQVDLVSTVPGRQGLAPIPGRDSCAVCEKKEACTLGWEGQEGVICYGRKRLGQVVRRLDPAIASGLTSCQPLLVQPTSISLNASLAFFESWLENVLPSEHFSTHAHTHATPADPLSSPPSPPSRVDSHFLLWPAYSMVERALGFGKKETADMHYSKQLHIHNCTIHPQVARKGLLFLSIHTFASLPLDMLTQWIAYSPNPLPHLPDPGLPQAIPHFKSYTRVMGVDKGKNSARGVACTCIPVAWSLLTSACLSPGAQGGEVGYGPCNCRTAGLLSGGFVDYTNFELGVLFRSQQAGVRYFMCRGECEVHQGLFENESVTSAIAALYPRHHHRSKEQQPTEIYLPFPFSCPWSQRGVEVEGSRFVDEVGALLRVPFCHDLQEASKYALSARRAGSHSSVQGTPANNHPNISTVTNSQVGGVKRKFSLSQHHTSSSNATLSPVNRSKSLPIALSYSPTYSHSRTQAYTRTNKLTNTLTLEKALHSPKPAPIPTSRLLGGKGWGGASLTASQRSVYTYSSYTQVVTMAKEGEGGLSDESNGQEEERQIAQELDLNDFC